VNERRRTPVRDLALGLGVSAFLLSLVFFGSFGMVELSTLVLTVMVLIWSASVDPARLVDAAGRPHLMLFALGFVAIALIFTAAVLISTVTEYLALMVAIAAFGTGLVRAVRHGMAVPEEG
jgi:hypothetical protein